MAIRGPDSGVLVSMDRRELFTQSIAGDLYVSGEWVCHTLELPWRGNRTGVSCIPNDTYRAFIRHDKPKGWRIELVVPGRPGVQIHSGKYVGAVVQGQLKYHTEGCILVGMGYGKNTVTNPEVAMKQLKEAVNKAIYGVGEGLFGWDHRFLVRVTGIQASLPGELLV